MKREFAISLSLAAMSFALIVPNTVRAQSDRGAQSGQNVGLEMVSARVALKQDVDADKVKQGDQIRTTLSGKVDHKNATELPSGTVILGVVTTDDMQLSGTSKLALNFNKAELKNGTII